MSSNDSIKKTLIVAFSLCIVCSVIVSTAAVMLKPAQQANQSLDRKRNILAAAGMLDENISIDEQFAKMTPRVVDLRTGKFSDAVDAEGYNERKAAKDPAQSDALSSSEDIAKVFRREHYAVVYVANDTQGEVDKIILPIRGYGLWGTLYGFIALEGDASTVAGIGFYEHKETPGLGGEVDNPRWKGLWPGKQVYKDGELEIAVVKGTVDPSAAGADYQVDGMAGATLTTRGVSNLVQFWLGDNGFAPFLNNLKSGEA
ncbi:Na(+)-translocating NADH-quinone reductase subunit C [Halieaceae bacterium IMCC8485]|uniref:Na(+)-translocating NADH-quinone reductase subunit C n=1 Tax=Candidatus Seongchinamella marina TaxID=2518990 RepID=A0ABT3SVX3_9GAMM|nr:Na(+)-translocating NADH-quinone reductase subunit C [Candidatus Seongchinamella marina]MCX2973454.1 Na(+)-translocating NADH-quinone reductase subunit C [Candidatus Seongchinamella marina]